MLKFPGNQCMFQERNQRGYAMSYTQSDQEIQTMVKNMKEWGKKIATTPENAQKALYEMGIVTKSGKLSKNYGG